MTDEELETFIKDSLEKDLKDLQDKPTEEVIELVKARSKAFLQEPLKTHRPHPRFVLHSGTLYRTSLDRYAKPRCSLCGGSEVIIHGEAVEPYTTACRCVGGPG